MRIDNLTPGDRREARETVTMLHSLGVGTSLSQVLAAEHDGDLDAWRAGRASTLELCRRRGWDSSQVEPELREDETVGPLVVLRRDHLEAALDAARDRARADEPGRISILVTLKSGGTRLRPLPVVRGRYRRGGGHLQVLTQRTWELKRGGRDDA